MVILDLFTFENALALVTLSALEIVLGIDNIVFIAILAAKLPPEKRDAARRIGLVLAMLMRIVLLFSLSWIMGLTRPLFPLFGHEVTGRDLILLAGGIFLIGKATWEIHDKLEGEDGHNPDRPRQHAGMRSILIQIVLMDIIFSLDSVITAVGMVKQEDAPWWQPLTIMALAVMIAVGVMLIFARPVSDFVERHPTIKMLALSFLLLIGVMLTVEGFGKHIEKGYIYFAMGFSLFVELLNIRLRRARGGPVPLRHTTLPKP